MALVLGVVACAMGYMLMSYANDNKIWITKHDALLRRLQQATKKNRLFTQDLLTCKAKGKEMLLANNENVKVIAGFKEDLKELKNDVTANDNKFMKCYRFYQDVKDILGLTEQVGSRFKDPVDGNVPLAVFTEVEDNIRTLQRNLTNEIDEKRSAIENKEEALSLNEQLREAAKTVKQNMKEAQAQFQDQLNDCNSKMAVVSSNAENSKARIATLEGNLQTSQHEVARLELQDKIKTQVMENTTQMMTDMAAARKSEVNQPKQVAPSESKPVVKTNQGSIVDTSVTLEKPSEPVVAQEVEAEVVAEKTTLPEEKELPTVDLTKKISVSSDAVKAVQPSSDLTIAKENIEDSF
jgi:chromosome segregation ATPase